MRDIRILNDYQKVIILNIYEENQYITSQFLKVFINYIQLISRNLNIITNIFACAILSEHCTMQLKLVATLVKILIQFNLNL